MRGTATLRASPRALGSLSRAMFVGFVRDRAALVFSILIPVLFLALFGSIYKSSGAAKISVIEVGRVAVLDRAEASAPAQLGRIMTISRSTDLGAALDAVRKGSDDAVVQQQGRTVVVRYSIADQTTAGIVQAVFSSIVQQADAAAAARTGGYQLTSAQVEDKSLTAIQYIAPGLLGWAIASGGAFGAAITLVEWRRTKLLRRLRLAPVSVGTVVLARVGLSLVLALVQLAVFLGIATLPYFGLRLSADWWMAVPVVLCGTLAFMSIGLLVGSVTTSQQAATAIANVIILTMAFLGGAFVPLDFAPAWIRDVSYAMPLRYLVTGVQNVMARGEGVTSALPAIGILLGLAAVLTLISVRAFRWEAV
jgi:ABC-2 type transport system permease protein